MIIDVMIQDKNVERLIKRHIEPLKKEIAEIRGNRDLCFQPDFGNDDTLATPDGMELWSYYVYGSFDRARRDFPDRKILAFKVEEIENPYFIDGDL